MSLDFLEKTESFKQLLESVRRGETAIEITGLIEAAKPYFLSLLAEKSKKRIIVIEPSFVSLSFLEERCQFFLQQFSSSLTVGTLPAITASPYQEIPPSLEVVSSRMKFFHDLLHHPSSFILTNLFGLLKPFPCLQDLEKSFLELQKGQQFVRDKLLEILRGYGYVKEDLVVSAGEYAWRGGVVDVFSPWEKFPLRIEFRGDEIFSLRYFDPSTQSSVEKLDEVLIPSLREFPSSMQFLEEWLELARKNSRREEEDLAEKWNLIVKGDFPPSFVFLSLLHSEHFVPFESYLRDSLLIIDDFDELEKEWEKIVIDLEEQHQELQKKRKFHLPPREIYPPLLWEKIRNQAICLRGFNSAPGRKSFRFPFQSVPRFENKIPFFLKYLKRLRSQRERCFIYLSNPGLRQRINILLGQNKILSRESSSPFVFPKENEVVLLVGNLEQGFSYPPEKISYFSEKDFLSEEKVIVSRPAAPRKPFLSHFEDFKVNDYVVHTDYGIGLFKGLVKMEVESKPREFMEIHYRDEDKLYVPVEDLNLVQRYTPVAERSPLLDKLGSNNWQKTKERTKRAIEKLAKELLLLYARRKAVQGFSFSPEGEWQREFESMFEYEETEDQLRTIKEIKKDMEASFPMDRLLCGDVGYGKTEVAIRAAFKAVMDGKQVAVLCPTTVLASQHLKTFRSRMLLFPVRVEALTRLQSKKQQQKTVEELRKGIVDIVIGTHRLLSKDVEFRDLGLLIIDEEQRFGVYHKEKIKQIKSHIDVLTLTATPIPRTLNLSLIGLRDISLIETPPRDRLAVHTVVTHFDKKLIASALRFEIGRGGQVYYIHNRIEDIEEVAGWLDNLVSEAKVAVIHGKMPSAAIEKRMMDFISRKYNVLVSTTIIENGIDIPLVNTLIVDCADNFGLAQLYQLRGRVGRSSRQAFAYFLVPPFTELTPLAKERLVALKEFSELGSGFRLAARDLEIRGAGNLFGPEQHGYMEAVGFDYYMELLNQTIKELRGEKVEERKSEINMRVDIRIPEDYLPQINLRLNIYKRISSIESLEEIEVIHKEIEDRFGPPPSSVKNLLHYGVIRFLAQRMSIKSIDRIGNKLILKFWPASSFDLKCLAALLNRHAGNLTPQGVMSLCLFSTRETEIMEETILILKELYGYTIIH